jgi:hypothetical protein
MKSQPKDSAVRDYIVNLIPNPGPASHRRRRLAFALLPPGTSAEEATKLLSESAERHKANGPPGDGDADACEEAG